MKVRQDHPGVDPRGAGGGVQQGLPLARGHIALPHTEGLHTLPNHAALAHPQGAQTTGQPPMHQHGRRGDRTHQRSHCRFCASVPCRCTQAAMMRWELKIPTGAIQTEAMLITRRA